MAGVKPSAISSATVAAFKTKLGYLTQAEADLRYPQISEGEPVDLDALLALKADLASPTFTGTPLVPTAAAGTNTTQVANAAFVHYNSTQRLFPVSGVSSGLPITNTASTTTENTVLTIPIPANTIGSNGTISIQALLDVTSNTNQKFMRIYIDAVNASNLIATFGNEGGNGLVGKWESFLWNINGTQHVFSPTRTSSGGWGTTSMTTTSGSVTRNFDFTQSHNIIITLQTSVATDAFSINGLSVFTTY